MDKVSKVTGCGFEQGACQGFGGCTGCGVQQGACQVFNKDVKDFKVAQAVEFSKVHVWNCASGESLPNPGFQFVSWNTNARINGLVAVDLETLVSQALSDYP